MSDTRIKMFKKRPGPRIRPKSRVKEKEEVRKGIDEGVEEMYISMMKSYRIWEDVNARTS